MNTRSGPRPGGRSARVQAAVHEATLELLARHDRADITVPLIAARAGVTPSTIYRRWGDLGELLADVALQRMRPDGEPADTGTVKGDLHAWAEQYLEEMSSEVGLSMLRDVLTASSGEVPVPCRCAALIANQIVVIVDRGVARRQAVPEVDAVMDGVVAPIVYRLLFGAVPPTHEQVRGWVEACLKGAQKKRVAAKSVAQA